MPFHGSNRGSNPLGDAIGRVFRLPGMSWVVRSVRFPWRNQRLKQDVAAGLPASLQPVLEFVAWPVARGPLRTVVERGEAVRRDISLRSGDGVEVWYSPQPGSWADNAQQTRPAPGKPLKLPWARVATTGKDRFGGTLLHLLAAGAEAQTGLELGSCAGISARYIAAARSVKELLTVEGSAGLYEVAREVLADCPNVTVIHASFSEAIDRFLADSSCRFDFLFIDGHHERRATLHYFDRLRPCIRQGAVVVFDDVSWSEDMHLAWEALRRDRAFAHTFSLGNLGVCIVKTAQDDPNAPPRFWDMSYLLPPASIGQPWGWR